MNVESRILQKLVTEFAPEHLEVVNESGNHSVPEGSETHFKVVIVSNAFEGLSRVKRQQEVYRVLVAEMAGPVHALAQHTYTPAEWSSKEEGAPASPQCAGGSRLG